MLVFVLANILMLPLGFMAARTARWIFAVPKALLNAAILVFCVVGAYSINNTLFGVGIMLVLGVLAYHLEAAKFAIAPIILGIVLGPLLEKHFVTAMIIANGDFLDFFSRPVAAVLGVATLALWLTFGVGALRAYRSARRKN